MRCSWISYSFRKYMTSCYYFLKCYCQCESEKWAEVTCGCVWSPRCERLIPDDRGIAVRPPQAPSVVVIVVLGDKDVVLLQHGCKVLADLSPHIQEGHHDQSDPEKAEGGLLPRVARPSIETTRLAVMEATSRRSIFKPSRVEWDWVNILKLHWSHGWIMRKWAPSPHTGPHHTDSCLCSLMISFVHRESVFDLSKLISH